MNMLASFINYDKGLLYNKCVLMNTFVSKDGLNDKLEIVIQFFNKYDFEYRLS